MNPLPNSRMRYYIDCEFDGHNGALISMALVRNRRDSLMIVVLDTEVKDPWVRENVLPILHNDQAGETVFCTANAVGANIGDFLGEDQHPIVIADSPVDIARFCAALSTGLDGSWANTPYPHMTFEVHNVDCYPTALKGAVQHNAWWDAMALREKLAA